MPAPIARIPVVLLTGFLGSGKTTLLRALLQQPGWADTAVLINEWGAVGLDHHLAAGAADSTLLLDNGCVCCTVRSDLGSSLEALFWDRLHRRAPRFARVLIETTGIAEPGRIVELLAAQPLLAERYALRSIVCTVDGHAGAAQLQRHAECVAQVAVADEVVLSKADLAAPAELAALQRLVGCINGHARVHRSVQGGAAAQLAALAALAAPVITAPPLAARPALAALAALVQVGAPATPAPARVHDSVTSFTLPVVAAHSRAGLQALLAQTVQRHGAALLRIKGLVPLRGEVRPAVVQVVGDQVHALDTLPAAAAWHGVGFLVFITQGLSAEDLRASGLLQQLGAPRPG